MSVPAADEAGRARRIKRSAWGLAALALAFYLGFIAWSTLLGLG
jgi:MYXO-CTERM domain-containing protein